MKHKVLPVFGMLARRLLFAATAWIVAMLAFVCTLLVGGCGHVGPILGEVLQRADVAKLWSCREHRGVSLAMCIGIEAANQAVGIAADLALERLHRARDIGPGHAGASDYTPEERARAAADLDEAMRILRHEARIAEQEIGVSL